LDPNHQVHDDTSTKMVGVTSSGKRVDGRFVDGFIELNSLSVSDAWDTAEGTDVEAEDYNIEDLVLLPSQQLQTVNAGEGFGKPGDALQFAGRWRKEGSTDMIEILTSAFDGLRPAGSFPHAFDAYCDAPPTFAACGVRCKLARQGGELKLSLTWPDKYVSVFAAGDGGDGPAFLIEENGSKYGDAGWQRGPFKWIKEADAFPIVSSFLNLAGARKRSKLYVEPGVFMGPHCTVDGDGKEATWGTREGTALIEGCGAGSELVLELVEVGMDAYIGVCETGYPLHMYPVKKGAHSLRSGGELWADGVSTDGDHDAFKAGDVFAVKFSKDGTRLAWSVNDRHEGAHAELQDRFNFNLTSNAVEGIPGRERVLCVAGALGTVWRIISIDAGLEVKEAEMQTPIPATEGAAGTLSPEWLNKCMLVSDMIGAQSDMAEWDGAHSESKSSPDYDWSWRDDFVPAMREGMEDMGDDLDDEKWASRQSPAAHHDQCTNVGLHQAKMKAGFTADEADCLGALFCAPIARAVGKALEGRDQKYAAITHAGAHIITKKAMEGEVAPPIFYPLHGEGGGLADKDPQWNTIEEIDHTGFQGLMSFAPLSLGTGANANIHDLRGTPPLATTRHHSPPLATTRHHSPPLATTRHHSPPLATTRPASLFLSHNLSSNRHSPSCLGIKLTNGAMTPLDSPVVCFESAEPDRNRGPGYILHSAVHDSGEGKERNWVLPPLTLLTVVSVKGPGEWEYMKDEQGKSLKVNQKLITVRPAYRNGYIEE
jgi:hypothetical protein